jgi:hypothetical protein
MYYKTGAREAKDANISSVEKPCQQLTLAWPQTQNDSHLGTIHTTNTRQKSSKIGAWGKHWPLLYAFVQLQGWLVGQGGRRTGVLANANTVSTANQSFCSSGLSCKKPAAACCLGHFSCGMMIRGGEAELEREWIGVAGGRLRVLVALSTICGRGLSFGCRLVVA